MSKSRFLRGFGLTLLVLLVILLVRPFFIPVSPAPGTVLPESLAGVLPGAQLALIPQVGHVPQEEQPASFLQAVDQFVGYLEK